MAAPPKAQPDRQLIEAMTVRQIIAKWPSTRGVFESAGLMGCGGPQGPDERLDFFANVHRVPVDALKRALQEAARSEAHGRVSSGGMARAGRALPVAPAAPLVSEPAHRYVPFLLCSIASTLTFGATLGMINLARLTTPYFGGMTPSSVRAHAFVQVFGFVGLFVMGIACHVLPRFASRPLATPSLTRVVLGLQLGGVVTIVAAFMLNEELIRWAWVAGSLALVAAGSMFFFVIVGTIGGAPATARVGRWVIAGAVWQVAAACGSLVAAWQNDVTVVQALWPAALWGFAGSWIFGIGRRIFPGFLGWRPRWPRAEDAAFVVYQAGVALSTAGAWPAVTEPPAALVVAGALALMLATPLYSWCLGIGTGTAARHDVERGYQRYVLTAWVWLFVALAMGPLWTLGSTLGGGMVPPLVTDFARHALAFGFVTQIMMGVATRVLPVFTGNALWSPRARTAAFYLLNTSLVLRALEAVVASGFLPGAWPLIALSGPPAVAAVGLFSLNVVFTIHGRRAVDARSAAPSAMADRRVGDILEIPGALDLMVEAGFTPLKNPIMRATLAGGVTLRQACGLKGVPLESLVSRLEALPPHRMGSTSPQRPLTIPAGSVTGDRLADVDVRA